MEGSWGIFTNKIWEGSVGVKMATGCTYHETSGNSEINNSAQARVYVSFTGDLFVSSSESNGVGQSRFWTYEQAFH